MVVISLNIAAHSIPGAQSSGDKSVSCLLSQTTPNRSIAQHPALPSPFLRFVFTQDQDCLKVSNRLFCLHKRLRVFVFFFLQAVAREGAQIGHSTCAPEQARLGSQYGVVVDRLT